MNIIKHLKFILIAFIVVALSSCSDDDGGSISGDPFVVAFENLSANIGEIEANQDIQLVYSETASQSGQITLAISATNAVYGEDFTTEPAAEGNSVYVPINQGANGSILTFNKINPNLDETVEIKFTITEIDYPSSQIQGNTEFSLNSSASLGRGFEPTVGGPNEGNQVYIDLSTETQTLVQRDSWDLGFYSGDEFRVGINGSIYMAAAQLESTNIDEISQSDVADLQAQVAIGTFDPANEAYIDAPDGDITKTAIDAISLEDAENKVYLVNLGYEIGTDTPDPGSVAVAGEARGWKKIRVLRSGDAYVLQYANLNDTTHQEVTIEKSSGYNFTFFSFNTNTVVSVEPEGENWDLNFTVFTNIIEGSGSYGYVDFVLHNRKGGVVSYEALVADEGAYADFALTDVDNGAFQVDQRAIGSNWRDVFEGVPFDDRFYVLKDPNGNIYKIRFLAMLNDNGVRGYPEFEYKLLQ